MFPTLVRARTRNVEAPAFTSSDTRNRLAQLLTGDLNFHEALTRYASHNFHAFAAKFPPQLPRLFIQSLTLPGDLVLDPMMGSGTTVVEAFLEGRRAIGVDLDPLAVRIGRVKVTPLSIDRVRETGARVLAGSARMVDSRKVEHALDRRLDSATKQFVDYWFLPATQRELMALVLSIEQIEEPDIRSFFELCLSSIIITKSGGVSMARDLAHSRPHLDKTKRPKNALEQYGQRLRKSLKNLEELNRGTGQALVQNADARQLPLANDSVSMIITSPPYANAIDYMRAHKFSLVWLGAGIDELSEIRATYIGTERVGTRSYGMLPESLHRIISDLASKDAKRAAILQKYFIDMEAAMKEMYRVIMPGAAVIVVVGASTMRGIDVGTHQCLADLGTAIGFDLVGLVPRQLDRNRRMMPARFGKKSDSMIEQRMHDEYVIGFVKPLYHGDG